MSRIDGADRLCHKLEFNYIKRTPQIEYYRIDK